MTVVVDTTGVLPTVLTGRGSDQAIPTRVLVMGMAHRDGTVHATEVYPVAEACGLTAEQVRSCLRRLVGEGLFIRGGEGREAVFTATPAGMAALSSTLERHRLAYAQDAAGRGWDRRWRLVAFAIPETRRSARDSFRDRLLELGGAAVQNGLYISPHRWHDEVIEIAARLEVDDHVTALTTDDLEIAGNRDPRVLAQNLWALEDVAHRYQHFIDVYRDVPDELDAMHRRDERLPERDFLPGALHMAVQFGDCFMRDPLLPPELLPRPWPGRAARDLLARSRRLGVLARQDKSGPALFSVFDDVLEQLA